MSFKLKSGNTSAFKMMGSSPAKGLGKALETIDKASDEVRESTNPQATEAKTETPTTPKDKPATSYFTPKDGAKKVEPTPTKMYGKKSPSKFIDLTKGLRDKVAMAATGGAVGDKSKGTDRDSLMGSSPAKQTEEKEDKPGTVVSRTAKKVGKSIKREAKEAVRQFKDEGIFTRKGRDYQKDQRLAKKGRKLEKKKELHEVRKKYRRQGNTLKPSQ